MFRQPYCSATRCSVGVLRRCSQRRAAWQRIRTDAVARLKGNDSATAKAMLVLCDEVRDALAKSKIVVQDRRPNEALGRSKDEK